MNQTWIVFSIYLLFSVPSFAEMVEGPLPEGFIEYDLRFTNPVCQTKRYVDPVPSVDGSILFQRPKSFCNYDSVTWQGREMNDGFYNSDPKLNPNNPQAKLFQWINDRDTKEIFMAYLSFSNGRIENALCAAVRGQDVFDDSIERGSSLKLTIFMDSQSDRSKLDELIQCAGSAAANITALFGGHHSYIKDREPEWNEWSINWGHNKIFMVNPKDIGQGSLTDSDLIKVAFSSGNMSSGPFLHHENWHFITTEAETFFAQAHVCAMKAIVAHGQDNVGFGGDEYGRSIADCKRHLVGTYGLQEEDMISTYFVPGEHYGARQVIRNEIGNRYTEEVLIAAHQFSLNDMLGGLHDRFTKRDNEGLEITAKIIVDDNTYNVAHGGSSMDIREGNYNDNLSPLMERGAETRFMETGAHLQHNKFLVFNNRNSQYSSVFTGAGNLTYAAFSTNLENFYHIRIPGVVNIFNRQYAHMWDMSTPEGKLPDPVEGERAVYELLGDWPSAN